MVLCCTGYSAQAQDASVWAQDNHSAVRLVAGSRSGPVLLGGIVFRLDPGWKTYWRMPGDSGIPPQFDFSASDNVEAVTVLWPAPVKFPDGAGGQSLGYVKQVVLPLRIVAKSSDKPVTLRAKVHYAICEKMCVPVEAKVELPFTSVASTEDTTLAAALDSVPKPAKVGDPLPLSVIDVRRDRPDRVLVDVTGADAQDSNLYVEGPTPDWALPIPARIKDAPNGIARFAFELDGLPPGASADGAALKFTLVGHGKAYEFNVTLN